MKNIETTIREAVEQVDLRKPGTIQAAANRILSEDLDVSAGQTVVVIDDPTYPFPGQKGRSLGVSSKGSGFVDVEFENGVKVPVQSSLLLNAK
jgi:hypothetical protein